MKYKIVNLGKAFHIVRGVKNLETTLGFYEKLGFKLLEKGNKPTNFALFTDGVINYLISEDKMNYTGLIYFNNTIDGKVSQLENDGIEFFWKDEQEGVFNQAMFEVIPQVFAINLVAHFYNEKIRPDGVSIVEFGKFGELAVPVVDRDETEKFMHKLGFKTMHKSDGSDGWYPWCIIQDELATVGLHQTDEFPTPVPTYFAENMEEVLPLLQERGINLTDLEGGIKKGNAKTIAPDGQIFYFFKGKI